MNIKFKDYELQPDRNETDVDKCFQKAMMACSDREKHFTEMEEDILVQWDSGDVLIEIKPGRGGRYLQNSGPNIRPLSSFPDTSTFIWGCKLSLEKSHQKMANFEIHN